MAWRPRSGRVARPGTGTPAQELEDRAMAGMEAGLGQRPPITVGSRLTRRPASDGTGVSLAKHQLAATHAQAAGSAPLFGRSCSGHHDARDGVNGQIPDKAQRWMCDEWRRYRWGGGGRGTAVRARAATRTRAGAKSRAKRRAPARVSSASVSCEALPVHIAGLSQLLHWRAFRLESPLYASPRVCIVQLASAG